MGDGRKKERKKGGCRMARVLCSLCLIFLYGREGLGKMEGAHVCMRDSEDISSLVFVSLYKHPKQYLEYKALSPRHYFFHVERYPTPALALGRSGEVSHSSEEGVGSVVDRFSANEISDLVPERRKQKRQN
jgi:hypothetical protein